MNQSLRFLFLFFVTVIMMIVLWISFFNTHPEESYSRMVLHGVDGSRRIAHYFRNADDWNIVALVFIGAVSVILFCLNDLILRFVQSRFLQDASTRFLKGGLLWISRTAVNCVIFTAEFILVCYLINVSFSSARILSIGQIKPGRYPVLLLGTSKYLQGSSKINLYYQQRIETCVALCRGGLVSKIIISGDRASSEYDETRDMKEDLIKRGIPANVIVLDPQGHRTFDSIQRLKHLIAQNQTVIIISQYFHLERAIYLANSENVRCIGVAAEGDLTLKMLQRELFAKTRVLLDIYVFNTQTDGLQFLPRRKAQLNKVSDIMLLIFVISLVGIAGRMTRQLLAY